MEWENEVDGAIKEANSLMAEMKKYRIQALLMVPFLIGIPIGVIYMVGYETMQLLNGLGSHEIIKSLLWLVFGYGMLRLLSDYYPDRQMNEAKAKLAVCRVRLNQLIIHAKSEISQMDNVMEKFANGEGTFVTIGSPETEKSDKTDEKH